MRLKRFYHIVQVLTMIALGLCIGAYSTGDEAGMFSFFLVLFILLAALWAGVFLRRRQQRRERARNAQRKNADKHRQMRPRPGEPARRAPTGQERKRGNTNG